MKEPGSLQILLNRILRSEYALRETLFFKTNSAILSLESQKKLTQLGEMLLKNPDEKIILIGHTDPTGTAFYNELLSEKRAKAARDFLIEKFNIPEEQILVDWFSEFQPAKENRMGRRVEVYLLEKNVR